MERNLEQENDHIKQSLFLLKELLDEMLPTRIVGDGKRRKPDPRYAKINHHIEELKKVSES